MKIQKLFFLLCLVILCHQNSQAQETHKAEASFKGLEIGMKYMVSNEIVSYPYEQNEDRIFHSFGLFSMKTFRSNLFLRSGINYRNFGTKVKIRETTLENPEGTGESYFLNYNLTAFELPVDIGYYFLKNKKIRLGAAIGIKYSFLNTQKIENRGVEADLESSEKNHFSVRSNLEFGVKLGKRVLLNILPFWEKQINNTILNNNRTSVGCEIGLSFIR